MSSQMNEHAKLIPWKSIRAILFDWAGTTIDYGSVAPVEVVKSVFLHHGLEVTEAEAREPMGQAKIDHLKAVLAMPRIAALWRDRYQSNPTDLDIERLYRDFLVLQKQVLAKHSELIPGVAESIGFFQQMGIRIGSTTGYTRELMEVVLPIVKEAGYSPQVTVCSDEVAAGRPAPWSNFRAAEALGVYPMSTVMIVDDSLAGIQAGRNAGCISVAISKTGNALGLTYEAVCQLDETSLSQRLSAIEKEFYLAGADLVVESVEELAKVWNHS